MFQKCNDVFIWFKMCFPNSLTDHDFTRSPNSWVPCLNSLLLGSFSRVEVEKLSTWTWQLYVWVLESNIAPQYHFCKEVMWPWSDQSQQRMSNRHIIILQIPLTYLERFGVRAFCAFGISSLVLLIACQTSKHGWKQLLVFQNLFWLLCTINICPLTL